MDQWKALERWESDRLKQPIGAGPVGTLRGAGAGVPDRGR